MSARSEHRWQRYNRAYFDKPFGLAHPDAYSPTEQPAAPLPNRALVRRWMIAYLEDYIDDCGELQATQLVEAYALLHPQVDHWLDDPTHWIWEIPIQIANRYGLSY